MVLGSGIRDPGSGKNLFRIPDPGVKKHPIPDPGSGSATLQKRRNKGFSYYFCLMTEGSGSLPLTNGSPGSGYAALTKDVPDSDPQLRLENDKIEHSTFKSMLWALRRGHWYWATGIPRASQDCKKNCGEPCFVQADEDTDNMTATQLERRQVVHSYLGLYWRLWACNLCHRYRRLPRETIRSTKKQCCGSGLFFVPYPNFFHPGSASINLSILTQKVVLSSRKYVPDCSSLIPDRDREFLPIPDPGVKKATDHGWRGWGGGGFMGAQRGTSSALPPVPLPVSINGCKHTLPDNYHLGFFLWRRALSAISAAYNGVEWVSC